MNFFWHLNCLAINLYHLSLPPSPCLRKNGSANTRNSPFKLQGKAMSTYQVHQNVGCSRRIVCFFVQICLILWRLCTDSKATCRRWGEKPQNRPLSICSLITSRYTMLKHALFTTCHKTSALDHLQGVVLTKKICVYQALSLSPPLEERARGEVRGGWTQSGSNHLTAIFGQRVPYPASIWIVISSHRTVLVVYMEALFSWNTWLYLMLHEGDNA